MKCMQCHNEIKYSQRQKQMTGRFQITCPKCQAKFFKFFGYEGGGF